MSNGKKLKKGLTQYKEEEAYDKANNTVTGLAGAGGPDEENATKIPEKKKKELESYVNTLMYIMHNEKTRESVIGMLEASPPEESVPAAALKITRLAEDGLGKKGQKVPNDVKVAGASFVVSDLVELGNLGGLWGTTIGEQGRNQMLQDTMQTYIQEGLKDGTIDPIDLQREVEPLLTDEQRTKGEGFAQEFELPSEPTHSMAVNTIVSKEVGKEQKKTAKATEQLKALGGAAMGQPQGQPQGGQA